MRSDKESRATGGWWKATTKDVDVIKLLLSSIWLVELCVLVFSFLPCLFCDSICLQSKSANHHIGLYAETRRNSANNSSMLLALIDFTDLDLISLSHILFPFFSNLLLSAVFRFELPGAPLLMAGRLRGGATGANTSPPPAAAHAEAPSISNSSSSFFSFLGGLGRSGRDIAAAARPIADLAAAQAEEDDDVYASESDSESGSADEEGWRTRSYTKNDDGNNNDEREEGYINSYEPKGFEPDLGIRLIKGDGKCMFRALARGMARNKGVVLSPEDETRDADTLRLAVRDALCRSDARRQLFHEAVTSVEVAEGGLPKYCARLNDAGFWGGEVELMVISRLLQVPIYVYRSSKEAGVEKLVGYGFAPIVKYGEQYAGVSEEEGGENRAAGGVGGRMPVNLLYREGNHYDLLVA